MAVTESFLIKLLIFLMAVGTISIGHSAFCLSHTVPILQIDLQRYGGSLRKYNSRIDHAVAVMPDHSVWVSFPVGNKGLAEREGSNSAGRRFLHLDISGRIVSQCTWHMPANADIDFFPREGGAFSIRTETSIINLDANCLPIEKIAMPAGVMVSATSDNKMIALSSIGAAIRILNADTLEQIASIPLPNGVTNYRVSIWNRLILIRDTSEGKCFWTYRSNVPDGVLPTWHLLRSSDPEMVRAFGDEAIITVNWNARSPMISVSDIHGATLYSFPIGREAQLDTSLFPELSCVSPASGRAGIFFYDRRRAWWGQEKIVGEHIAVIDFSRGQTLLSLPVTEYDPFLNCSLSRDGNFFVVLRNLDLSIFDISNKTGWVADGPTTDWRKRNCIRNCRDTLR